MVLTTSEFEALLADRSKRIDGDIRCDDAEDHSVCQEFKAQVLSEPGYSLFVKGTYNPVAGALSFTLVYSGHGRIYGLDLGKDHRNPTGETVGEKHKHRWTEQYRDKHAYIPGDITAQPHDVVLAWEQFCVEASISHDGTMSPPRPTQNDLFL